MVAESVLVKHQLVILNRGRKRAPKPAHRGSCHCRFVQSFHAPATYRSLRHHPKSTLLDLQAVLTTRKYRLLFSPRCDGRPGPKGPTKELIDAVVAMKQRNPAWGCPRIAAQVALAFGVDMDRDVVRRILSVR